MPPERLDVMFAEPPKHIVGDAGADAEGCETTCTCAIELYLYYTQEPADETVQKILHITRSPCWWLHNLIPVAPEIDVAPVLTVVLLYCKCVSGWSSISRTNC
ncbi:MAG: hypothetical protein R2807_06530 [Chitinophagales bacterium]